MALKKLGVIMTTLRLIKTPPQPEKKVVDRPSIYERIYFDKLFLGTDLVKLDPEYSPQLSETLISLNKQVICFGVRALPHMIKKTFSPGWTEKDSAPELVEGYYMLSRMIDDFIAFLTPTELMAIFPVDKRYSGSKTGTIDYFSTMTEVGKIGRHNIIGSERVLPLLYEYHNRYLRKYLLAKQDVISIRDKLQGGVGIDEGFAELLGLTFSKIMKDGQGKPFLYDPVKQTTYKISKPRSRYLRVVK
jgi:hypothetical protein